MGVRAQLERKIENKRLEILEYESKLREATAFLHGLQEALKVLPREGGPSSVQILRPGSDMAKARDFLATLGRPAYIAEILEGIGIGRTGDKPKKSSVGSSLASYARKGEIFKRTAPNTFALIGCEEESTASMNQSEPPSDFGSEL